MKLKKTALSLTVAAFIMQAALGEGIVFSYNGTDVSDTELLRKAEAYAQSGAIADMTDIDAAIDYMVRNQLAPEAKAHELGLDVYSEQELEMIRKEADDYFEQQLDAYVEYYAPDMASEEKEELREEIRSYWKDMGTTVESAEETHLFNQTRQRLLDSMDIVITDEEIDRVFAEQAAKDEAYFKDNVKAYEYYTYYLGSDVWYIPEGYRSIQQILLNVDEDISSSYSAAKAAGEGLEEASQAVIDARRETIDEIYSKLDDGADFTELMMQYSEDPQLKEAGSELSYEVHPQSNVWVSEFTEGAFSEKMQNPGDVSDPIASSYGVHILYYSEDIPSGTVNMDDRIRESIMEYLKGQKQGAILDDWADDYELVIYETELQKAKEAAVEAAAQADR